LRPVGDYECLDSSRRHHHGGIVNGEPDPVELVREGRERELQELIEATKERFASALGASA
jgi:hypothetical protein